MTVPYIVETADGDSDLSYDELLQLASAAATGVIMSRGNARFPAIRNRIRGNVKQLQCTCGPYVTRVL